jgi:hypothetical protein
MEHYVITIKFSLHFHSATDCCSKKRGHPVFHIWFTWFLCEFAKMRKRTISFVMSARLPARLSALNNSAPTGKVFIKFDINFSKICRENSICIKMWQELNMKINIHFWSYLAQFYLEWEMFQIKVLEKIETYITFNNFLWQSYLFEITWKNIEQLGRPQMTIWSMDITCWILKASNTSRI